MPLEVISVMRGDVGDIALAFGIGLALPLAFGLLMWLVVRRYRRNPEVRRRQPNEKASKILLTGNLASIVVANVVRAFVGHGWASWLVGLLIVTCGATATYVVAKRHDPRLHAFRRPDPLPEGQEPDHHQSAV